MSGFCIVLRQFIFKLLINKLCPKMFDFVNFEFLMKLVYYITKCSGFLFCSISFKPKGSFVIGKSWFYVFASFAFGIFALSYEASFPIAQLTRSELLGMAVALIVKTTIWIPFIYKFFYLVNSKTFIRIWQNYQWCYVQV